jgi:hypothetical protein
MAAGNETGPNPPTSPFAWDLGNAREQDASVPPTPAVPADAVPADPVPAEPVPADPVPADPVPADPVPADPVPAADAARVPADPVPAGPAPAVPAPLPAAVPNAPPTDSPIDSLFGETQFRDYEGEPMVGPLPTVLNPFAGGFAGVFSGTPAGAAPPTSADPSVITGRSTPAPVPPRQPSAPLSKNQKLLFWIAGGVIALLVLAVLFVVGTKIPAPAPVAATKSATPKVSPSPTSTPVSTGRAAVGPHLWSDLRGGECVDPYTNPFELRYTVVDCAAPHPAQIVVRGTFPGGAAAYPGVEALQSQINLLCTAPGVIDLSTAGAYNDIQLQASYAATTEEWTKGQHDYFCFVNRAAGEPITGSVAGTPAK